MIKLRIPYKSVIDRNIDTAWVLAKSNKTWMEFIEEFPGVIHAEIINDKKYYTEIVFESEAYKTWFVMRWS